MYINENLEVVDPRRPPYGISFNGQPDTLQARDGSLLYRVYPARVQPEADQVATPDGYEIFEGKAYEVLSIRDKTREELNAELIPLIASYRDEKALTYVYKSVPMKLGDGARADLIALYFTAVLNPAIPDATVMANWQEEGYDTLPITAGDLRADGLEFMNHRQKCFTAGDVVKTNVEDYTTAQEIRDAIDAAYSES